MKESNKYKIKIELKLMKLLFDKQKGNLIFISIFTFIMITIILICGSAIFANLKNSVDKVINDYNYVRYRGEKDTLISNDIEMPMKINDYALDLKNAITKDINEIYNDLANISIFEMPGFFAKTNVVEVANSQNLKIALGRLPIQKNEIAITDYMARFLLNNGMHNYPPLNTIEEVLDKNLQLEITNNDKQEFDIDVCIVGIVQTSCAKHKNFNNVYMKNINFDIMEMVKDPYSIINEINAFDVKGKFEQDSAFFLQSAIFEYMNLYVVENFQKDLYKEYSSLDLAIGNTSMMVAKSNLNNKEIILPISYFIDENTYKEELANYENYEIFIEKIKKNIDIPNKTIIVEDLLGKTSMGAAVQSGVYRKEFNIIDIIDNYKYPQKTAMIGNGEFNELISLTEKNYDNQQYIDGFVLCHDKKNVLIDNMDAIFFPEKKLIVSGFNSILPFSTVLLMISVVFCFLSIGFMIYSIINICKTQQKNMAIIKMLGYSNSSLMKTILIPIIIMFLSCFVLAIALSAIVLSILNNTLTFNIGITIYIINYIPVLIIFGIMLIAISLGIQIGMRKIKKTDPLKLVKD